MIADGSLSLKLINPPLQPLAIGIVLCSVVGIGFGIGMGLSRAIEWLSLPIFIVLQAAPMAAIIPLIALHVRHRRYPPKFWPSSFWLRPLS